MLLIWSLFSNMMIAKNSVATVTYSADQLSISLHMESIYLLLKMYLPLKDTSANFHNTHSLSYLEGTVRYFVSGRTSLLRVQLHASRHVYAPLLNYSEGISSSSFVETDPQNLVYLTRCHEKLFWHHAVCHAKQMQFLF